MILLRTRLTILSGHISHGNRTRGRPQRCGGLCRGLGLGSQKVLRCRRHITHGDRARRRTQGGCGLLNTLRRRLLPAPNPLNSWRIELRWLGEGKILTLTSLGLRLGVQILIEDWLRSALYKYRDVTHTGAHSGRRLGLSSSRHGAEAARRRPPGRSYRGSEVRGRRVARHTGRRGRGLDRIIPLRGQIMRLLLMSS